MNYIALNGDTYILHIGGTTTRITKKQTVGFSRIVKLLKENTGEQEIREILEKEQIESPVQAYFHPSASTMSVIYLDEQGYLSHFSLKTGKKTSGTEGFENNPDTEFVGLYACLDSVKEEWPEYCL